MRVRVRSRSRSRVRSRDRDRIRGTDRVMAREPWPYPQLGISDLRVELGVGGLARVHEATDVAAAQPLTERAHPAVGQVGAHGDVLVRVVADGECVAEVDVAEDGVDVEEDTE